MKKSAKKDILKRVLTLLFHSEEKEKERKNYELKLGDLVEKYGSVPEGRIQMVNLRNLIATKKIDDSLLEIAEKIALAVIADHLKSGEYYLHDGVGVYGFLFPKLKPEAATLKCAVIADDIARHLTKENHAFSKMKFENSTQNVDKRAFQRRSAALGETPKTVANYLEVRAQRDMENKKILANQAIERMTMRDTGGADVKDAAANTDWATHQRKGVSSNDLLKQRIVAYSPIWNVGNKLLSAYRPQLIAAMDGGGIKLERHSAYADYGYSAIADLDLFILEEALKNLHLVMNAGHKVLLVIPVHFSTVDHANMFTSFILPIVALEETRRRFVVLELVDCPRDLPASRIQDTIAKMRHAVRAVMVSLPVNANNLKPWKESLVHAVGFNNIEEEMDERQLIEKIDNFVEKAETAGLHSFVYGLSTLSMVTAAVFSGISYIEGSAVKGLERAPKYVEPFESENLFKNLVS